MLEKARERMWRKEVRNARLLQMDAADLRFPDDSFDIVYAPYLISVVPDPVKVACEMRRVCRPGGRIIFLNHFLSPNLVLSRAERMISPFTVHIGFKSDLDLPAFLAQAETRAGLDREGQHSAHLVARDLREGARGLSGPAPIPCFQSALVVAGLL